MNNFSIGILDSGVGGLSIWREIVKKLPKESTIYLADSRNCPYGSKSSEEIYRLTRKLVRFLLSRKVKLIVLACNTITVSCLDRLRKEFPKTPIIGTVPVIKTAVLKTKNNKIGVLSTARTAKSKYQKNLIKTFAGGVSVLNIGTDKLVPMIEEGNLDGKDIESILKDKLSPFIQSSIDTLVLGCSHFPFLGKEIQKILGKKILILDSSSAIARQVERILKNNNGLSVYNSSRHILLTTGAIEKFKKLSKKLFEKRFKNVAIKRISL